MKTCPHCRQPIFKAPQELVNVVTWLKMPPRERAIAEFLLESWPRYVRSDVLVGHLYDESPEEPVEPEQVLCSHISKLRSKLKAQGWTIEAVRFGGYRFAEYGGARQ